MRRSDLPKVTTIDEYLARLDPAPRAALQALRETIQAAAPKAEECITYQLPAFRLHGSNLVAFGATRTHCAFYVMSGEVLDGFTKGLAGRDTSKGTVRFQPGAPLPAALVKRIVKARIAENEETARERTALKAGRRGR